MLLIIAFVFIAIVFAICNVVWTLRKRNAEWFRFLSLVFTILVICLFHSGIKNWVEIEAFDTIIDCVPTINLICWFGAINSIFLNGITLFMKKK